MSVNALGEDTGSARTEIHFLAALVDQLIRKMMASSLVSQADLNEVEENVARRIGSEPRAW
ncbi:hypothetical protein [Sphingomonas bacterium]|uniref:hypothetical protein n=1 Tax=Sphingomonas bacterium TaxID=1895847 RepID=UPI001576B382|nr:hypothetical protein [Sphingomonas bacterium]